MLGYKALLSLLWVIVCVVIILGLAYWVTRYVAQHGMNGPGIKAGSGGELAVLARQTLGRDQCLAVVKAGNRCYLLGVTASQITLLSELSPEEAASWQAAQAAPTTDLAFDFSKTLKSALRRKSWKLGR
jgi:flagellar protein FliO/FliZ